MTYVVYADVMLLWNVIINILVLYASSKILHISIRIRHILLWSVLTGVLTLAEYLLTINKNALIHHVLYAGIYVFMTILYFRRYTIRNILVHTLIIILSMNILYGIIHVLYQNKKIVSVAIIPAALLSVIVIITAATLIRKNERTSANEYRISIELGRKRACSIGYLDSGNFLSDCYTGNPVIILDYRLTLRLFDSRVAKYILQYHTTGEFDYAAISNICSVRFYPLPYRTISSEYSTMPAMRISALTFTDIGKTYSHITAGISRNKLINKNDYGVLLNESLKPNREEYSND